MIFDRDIETLRFEITKLETLVANYQQQISALQLGETAVTSLLEQTTATLQTLQPLGGGAIARLKSSLLALFGDIPPNTPGPNSDPDNDPDGGDDTPPSGDNEPEISTNLDESDNSQDAEDIGFTATPEQRPYAELVRLNERVCYFRRHDNTLLTAYFGCSSKGRCESWGRWLTTFSIAQGFEVRSPKHLPDCKYEVKLWGLNLAQIQALSESDLSRNPSR